VVKKAATGSADATGFWMIRYYGDAIPPAHVSPLQGLCFICPVPSGLGIVFLSICYAGLISPH